MDRDLERAEEAQRNLKDGLQTAKRLVTRTRLKLESSQPLQDSTTCQKQEADIRAQKISL